jgi:hypothetical protein
MEKGMRKFVLLAVLVASCSSRSRAPGAPAPVAAIVAKPPASELGGRDEKPGESAAAAAKVVARKIIRDGELTIVVKSYAPARDAVEDLARRLGGYLSASQVDHSEGDSASALLTLRIPSEKLDDALRTLAQLGTVVHESTRSNDITEQYYDLKARLSNARKLETRLLELLAHQAGKVGELLEVEREIARVREQIEIFEGKLRLYDNQVELSTLAVQLVIREKYVATAPPTLGADARETLGDSWDALRRFARAVVLMLVALLPWSPVIALPIWLLVRWRRRRRRAKA